MIKINNPREGCQEKFEAIQTWGASALGSDGLNALNFLICPAGVREAGGVIAVHDRAVCPLGVSLRMIHSHSSLGHLKESLAAAKVIINTATILMID